MSKLEDRLEDYGTKVRMTIPSDSNLVKHIETKNIMILIGKDLKRIVEATPSLGASHPQFANYISINVLLKAIEEYCE